jgi:hypothetical protein
MVLAAAMHRAGMPLLDRDARTGALVLPPARVTEEELRSEPSGRNGRWE